MNKEPVQDLLDFIAKYESNGDYDIMYGAGDVQATNRTLDEILKLQMDSPYPSTATGRYQLIHSTLKHLKARYGYRGNELFDPEFQDRLAIHLLKRRGLKKYQEGSLSKDEFILNLAKEWASLPRDEGGQSYYHGDGLNKAHAKWKDLNKIVLDIRGY